MLSNNIKLFLCSYAEVLTESCGRFQRSLFLHLCYHKSQPKLKHPFTVLINMYPQTIVPIMSIANYSSVILELQ